MNEKYLIGISVALGLWAIVATALAIQQRQTVTKWQVSVKDWQVALKECQAKEELLEECEERQREFQKTAQKLQAKFDMYKKEIGSASQSSQKSTGPSSSFVSNEQVSFYIDPYDGSVRPVEDFLKGNTPDPNSLEILNWSNVIASEDGNYQVRCRYRSKDIYGEESSYYQEFTFTPDGEVINVQDLDYRR